MSDIFKSHINAIVLKSLEDGPKYGLEIIDHIKQKSNNNIVIKQPTLYSSLRRLKEAFYIDSFWSNSDIGGGKRHNFELTKLGKEALNSHKTRWKDEKDIFSSYIDESFVGGSSAALYSQKQQENVKQETQTIRQEVEMIKEIRQNILSDAKDLSDKSKQYKIAREKFEEEYNKIHKKEDNTTSKEQHKQISAPALDVIKKNDAVILANRTTASHAGLIQQAPVDSKRNDGEIIESTARAYYIDNEPAAETSEVFNKLNEQIRKNQKQLLTKEKEQQKTEHKAYTRDFSVVLANFDTRKVKSNYMQGAKTNLIAVTVVFLFVLLKFAILIPPSTLSDARTGFGTSLLIIYVCVAAALFLGTIFWCYLYPNYKVKKREPYTVVLGFFIALLFFCVVGVTIHLAWPKEMFVGGFKLTTLIVLFATLDIMVYFAIKKALRHNKYFEG